MSSVILYAEVCAACILFLLLISIKVKKSVFLQTQKQLFLAVTISNMLLFALDAFWIFVDGDFLPVSTIGNWLLNGAYYVLSGLVGYIWFCYSEIIQQSRFAQNKWYRTAAFLPALALIVMTILSYKNHLLFYIDTDNTYHRGAAYSVQVILAYGYVIFTAVKAFVISLKTDDYSRKMELRALSSFVIPSIVAGAVQVALPRYPILCIGTTVGILYVYLTLQEQQISVDALTQLNNRNRLFQYLSAKLKRVPESKTLYLLMLDVNKFKSINDKYGHLEGDRALRLVSDCLKKACNQRNFFIARYGGDEFAVICELDADRSVQRVCDGIHAALSELDVPYSLSVSIGYARYTQSIKTQQDLISLADAELYKVKTGMN